VAGFAVAGRSWLHRLDPMSKLLMTGVALALVFVWPTLVGNAAVVLVVGVLLVSAGVGAAAAKAFTAVLLAAATFLVVQGIANPAGATLVVDLGPLSLYREGLAVGALLALRLFGILGAMLLTLLTTRPTDLVEALTRRGLPHRAGWVLASVVQIIPTVVHRYSVVRDAQAARGLEARGSPLRRLRAATAVLGPVVTSSLVAAEERALALEVRGFSAEGPRTYLREEQQPGWAPAVRAAAVAVLVVAVVWRLAG